MKNKIIFRILGALASALIIVAVFVPFVSVVGHSYSLWNSYSDINSLYLPIMIIVFGAVGVIFFSLNFKTEFAYTSAGAITFFVIMQTIEKLDQGFFNSLSIGYYLLAIGALLTGIMSFLCNLKSKIKVKEEIQNNVVNESSVLDQIDKLYNEQPNIQIQPIQPINIEPIPVVQNQGIQEIVQPVIEPIPVQNIEHPVNNLEQTQFNSIEVPTQINNISMNNNNLEQTQVIEPVVQPINQVSQDLLNNVQQPNFEVGISQNTEVPIVSNPVIEEFNYPINPVIQEFSQPVNPVVDEFNQSINPISQDLLTNEQQPNFEDNISQNIEASNPVIQDFSIPSMQTQMNMNSNNNELDIFGQPINRG